MPRARDEAGNIWELDANGNPVRMVQPAAPASFSGGIPGVLGVVPPNPAMVAKDQREESRQNAADRRAEQASTLAAQAAAREQQKFEREDTMAPPPGDTSKTGDEYLATIPPSLAGQVKALSEGRRAFPTGSALRSPAVQQLIAAATQFDPTLDAANAATRVATRKDFTSGKSAQNITALNTVLGHLGSLWSSAQDLHNRGFTPWNALANTAESTMGNPHLNNYNLARKAVADELERVFRQAGGNVSEIQEWKSTLSSSSSPEQFRGAMAKAVELLNSRLEALSAQYGQGMGRSADPMTFLKPHAQAVFQALQQGGSGVLPSGPGSAPPPPPLGQGGGPRPPGGVPRADYSSMTGAPGQSLAVTDPNSKLGAFKQTYRQAYDPAGAAALSAFIKRGAPYETAAAYATSHGFNPPPQADYMAAVAYQKANPGATPNVEADKNVPTTLGERLASSPLSAAVTGAAAGGTAGISDTIGRSLAGPGWDANRAALAALNPKSDVAGNVLGGAAGMLGGGALLGKAAPGALALLRKAPAITSDLAYGGIYGANENPGDPVMGAVTGALAGGGGGIAGRKLTKGFANVIAPPEGAFGPVYQQGAFPTIGQRFAKSGLAGRMLNTTEQAMQSMPGLGAAVVRGRDIPRDAAQLGAFNEGLGELAPFDALLGTKISALPAGVKPGTEPHVFASKAFGQAYDTARSGMRFVSDDPYKADITAFTNKVTDGTLSDEEAKQVLHRINNAVNSRLSKTGGELDGEAYKAAGSDLGRTIDQWSRDPAKTGMANALSDYQSIFDSAARRNSDPTAVSLLDAADRGYAKYAVVRNAAARVGGDPGTFTMKNLLRATQQEGGGVKSGPFLRGQANMQDYATAVQPLGDTLSNSGTGERLLTNKMFLGEQAVSGGAFGHSLLGGVLAHPGALAPFLPYAPGVNKLVTRAIAPRQYTLPPIFSEPLNLLGAKINDVAPFIGKAAVPGSLAYMGYAQ
jgi:hypothetical protein